MQRSNRFIASTFILVLVVAGLIFYLNKPWRGSKSDKDADISPVISASQDEGTFTSRELGISFRYAPEQMGDRTADIKRIGNKVYVYIDGMEPTTGQFVEIFSKKADETFGESIKRQVLAGYPSPDCVVDVSPSNIQGGYQVAEINYPPASDSDSPYWANSALCNEKYDKSNGIRYFLYDPTHPLEFAYLDIGQYSIAGPDGQPWQYNLTFIDR